MRKPVSRLLDSFQFKMILNCLQPPEARTAAVIFNRK